MVTDHNLFMVKPLIDPLQLFHDLLFLFSKHLQLFFQHPGVLVPQGAEVQ